MGRIIEAGLSTNAAIVAITGKGGFYFNSREGDVFDSRPNKE